MKTQKILLTLGLVLTLLLALNIVSASLIVDSVNQDALYPGGDSSLSVKIKNTFNYDLNEDVRMSLVFSSVGDITKPVLFSSVGSSSDSVDGIDEDDTESFSFDIKASNSIEPGDYVLPYVISYIDNNDTQKQETGTISVHVNSKTSLDFSVSQNVKVIGMQDKVTLKIVNKGFGEIKFVSVSLNSQEGYTLLSEDKIYIGSIASDDSDTASFDVVLNKANPKFSATITYKDFENNDKTQTINADLTAYTREKALELGLIKKSNAPMITGVVIVVIILWIVWRAIKKRRKAKLNGLRAQNFEQRR